MPFATTWVDLESIMLRETGHSEEDKYHDFTRKWNKKQYREQRRKKRDKLKNRLLTIENKQIVTRGEGVGG